MMPLPLEHDPEKHALGLDPRVGTGFRIRSCSNNNFERDDDSKISHPAPGEVENGGCGRRFCFGGIDAKIDE
jgi:hypothetical protein